MNTYTYTMNQMRHTELMREAAHERLVNLATRSEAPSKNLSSRLLSPLGHALVQTGTYLLEHTKTEFNAEAEGEPAQMVNKKPDQIAYRWS